MKKSSLYSFVFFAILYIIPTNSYSSDAITPILNWRIIELEYFDILYPEGAEEHAQRTAATLEKVYDPLQFGKRKLKKSIIVLESQGSITNGWASPALSQSHLFLQPLPEPFNGFDHTHNWLDGLIIHEIRHLIQFENSKYGMTQIPYWLFGDISLIYASLLRTPSWYFEGDAVVAETAYTNGGRGRYPAFDIQFRTLIEEKGIPTYDELLGSSYKYPMPNHYKYGYQFISYGREKYGHDIWEKINKKQNQILAPYSWGYSVQKYTNLSLTTFAEEALQTRATQWKEQRERTKITDTEDLLPPPSEGFDLWTYSPQPNPDGSIFAYQSGKNIPSRIIKQHKNGEVEQIIQTGPRLTNKIHSVGTMIAWDEIREDPLRDSRSYNVIKILDMKGKVRTLGTKDRLFSPVLSPDATKIAVVQNTTKNTPALVVFDVQSEKELWRLDFPYTDWLRTPAWTTDGKGLVYLRITDNDGISLEMTQIADKQPQIIVEASHIQKSNPMCSSEYIFYSTTISGLDAIWAVSLKDGKKYRVISRPYGAFDPKPSLDENYLYFTDYNYLGTAIQRIPLEPSKWEAEDEITKMSANTIEPIVEQINDEPILFSSPETPYASKKYIRAIRPNHLAGYLPRLIQEDKQILLGFADPTQLNDISFGLGISREQKPMGSIIYTNNALPVELSFGFENIYRNNSKELDIPEGDEEHQENISLNTLDYSQSWFERSFFSEGELPLYFRNGPWMHYINISTGFSSREISNVQNHNTLFDASDVEKVENGQRNEFSFSIAAGNYLRVAPLSMVNRWSNSIFYSIETTPFGGDYQGTYQASQLQLDVPGFFKLDGFSVVGSWQLAEGVYIPMAKVFTPRVLTLTANESIYSGGVAYKFPISYPDKGIKPLLFVNRIRGGIYYEVGHFTKQDTLEHIIGADILFDSKVLRFIMPLTLGMTAGVNVETQKPFVMSVSEFTF